MDTQHSPTPFYTSRSLPATATLSLFLVLISHSALAYVDDPWCPDDLVNEGESLAYSIIDHSTGELVNPEEIQPISRNIDIYPVATALGYCTVRFWSGGSGGSCTPTTYQRTVYQVACGYSAQTSSINGSYSCGHVYGIKPGGGTTTSYHLLDSHDQTTSTGPLNVSLASPGTYSFSLANFINTTYCELSPSRVDDSFTLITHDAANDKELGCHEYSVGNPCNPASGNKFEREEDYAGPVLPFARYYNSQLELDVGLGYGWTSTYHKRLERYADHTLRARRPDGRAEPFAPTSNGWQGEPDATFTVTQDTQGYLLSTRDGWVERYDLSGRIVEETDPSGKSLVYAYDQSGRLQSVHAPFGHSLGFSYDASGRLSTLTDPGAQQISYGYDSVGNLVSATYQDAQVRHYHYEASRAHLLTGITDENGDRFSRYAYDSSGRAASTEHAVTSNGVGQERFTLSYNNINPAAPKTTVTDAIGTTTEYTFQPNFGRKNLKSKKNLTDNGIVNQAFDGANNLLSRTDELGRTTTFTYNASRQRTSATEANGSAVQRTTNYEYLSTELDLPTLISAPSVFSGRNRQTVVTYGDQDVLLPTAITQEGNDPDGNSVFLTIGVSYTTEGQLESIDGPRTDLTDITTFEYYNCATGAGCGQLKKVTNALGHTTTYDAYDAHGRLLTRTAPNGLRESYTYDSRGRVGSVTRTPLQGAAQTTTYAYDAAGLLTSISLPTGYTLTLTHDAAHALGEVVDSLGHRVTFNYDAKGNRTEISAYDPNAILVRATAMTYDVRNYLTTVNSGGSVTRLVRDVVGQLTADTDPNQHTTAHSRDGRGRLLESIDVLGGVLRRSYDPNNRPTGITAPNGAQTAYAYDDLGNLVREVSPDRGILHYLHDQAGNTVSRTDARGVTVTYRYDALNRIVSIDYPGTAEDVTLTYDNCLNGVGRLCGIQDASGSRSYQYDSFGNVTEERRTELGVTYVTGFSYDAESRPIAINYLDGRTVAYTRDAAGRLVTIATTVNGVQQVVADDIGHRIDGLSTGQTLGNGLAESHQFDTRGRLTQLTIGAVHSRTYGYDAKGNVLGLTSDGATTSYGYDVLDRLTSENQPIVIRSYAYDANGNRLRKEETGAATVYAYMPTSNRLASVGGTPVVHDSAGSLTQDSQGRTFVYGSAGRLLEVYVNGALAATYTYDALGRRTRKLTGTGTVVYHYDLNGRLIAESHGSGAGLRSYIWGDGAPVAQIDTVAGTENISYLHADHLGTPRVATSAAGAVVWRWEGDAFGNSAPNSDADGDGHAFLMMLRFPGQLYDAESGLHYNYFRDYDPSTGRYIEADPIGLKGGNNLYRYVGGNPVTGRDPFGLADLNLFNQSTDNGLWQQTNLWYPPGVYSISGHGNPTNMVDQNGNPITPANVADMLMNNPYWYGDPIYLDSCSTGKGPNSFAQQLANLTGVSVTAPTEDVITSLQTVFGQVISWSESVANGGTYQTFHPAPPAP